VTGINDKILLIGGGGHCKSCIDVIEQECKFQIAGIADLGEIEDALDVLADSGTPLENITVLHCNTEYPTPFEDVNLKAMTQAIRNIEKALGNGIKHPSQSEVKIKLIVRKSLVASQPIKTGEQFSAANITAKRPGTGISPMPVG